MDSIRNPFKKRAASGGNPPPEGERSGKPAKDNIDRICAYFLIFLAIATLATMALENIARNGDTTLTDLQQLGDTIVEIKRENIRVGIIESNPHQSTLSVTFYNNTNDLHILKVFLSSNSSSPLSMQQDLTPVSGNSIFPVTYTAPVTVSHAGFVTNTTLHYNLQFLYTDNLGIIKHEKTSFNWNVQTLDFSQLAYFWIILMGVVVSRYISHFISAHKTTVTASPSAQQETTSNAGKAKDSAQQTAQHAADAMKFVKQTRSHIEEAKKAVDSAVPEHFAEPLSFMKVQNQLGAGSAEVDAALKEATNAINQATLAANEAQKTATHAEKAAGAARKIFSREGGEGSRGFQPADAVWIGLAGIVTLLIFSSFQQNVSLTKSILLNLAAAFGFGFGFDKVLDAGQQLKDALKS